MVGDAFGKSRLDPLGHFRLGGKTGGGFDGPLHIADDAHQSETAEVPLGIDVDQYVKIAVIASILAGS